MWLRQIIRTFPYTFDLLVHIVYKISCCPQQYINSMSILDVSEIDAVSSDDDTHYIEQHEGIFYEGYNTM